MKRYQFPTLVLLCFILLGTTALGASASSTGRQASQATPVTSPGRRVTMAAAAPHVVNMQKVPKETSAQAAANAQRQAPPLGTGVSPAVYAKRKAAAAHSQAAPKPGTAPMTPPTKSGSAAPRTPTPITQFAGMADSAATCSLSECAFSSAALAASFSQVVQGVNASIAVYNLSGTLQPGWPKTAQNFFGVPNPGSCDPAGPFLYDPRAFYDQNFNRFWVEIDEVDGSLLGDACANTSILWIAVSQTGNATGAWNIYHFDMAALLGFWADFPELGFDQQAVYFSANLLSFSDFSFQFAEYFGVNKFNMMNGKSLAITGLLDPTLGGAPLDTLQPTLGEALQVGGPLSGQFIASENIDFGNGECVSGCNGVVIITMRNPTTSPSPSMLFVSTDDYALAPDADQPGCTACVNTFDTRITATPTWHNGLITFSLNTSFVIPLAVVPAIFWGQIAVSLNDDGSISGAFVFQQGYLAYGTNNNAAMYGALGTDGDGDVFMVYNFSGDSDYPSLVYTSRRVTYPLGFFHDTSNLVVGAAPYTIGNAGLYTALSPSGVPFTDDIWLSGAYANANGDWSTEIGHVKFVKGQS